MVPVGHVFNEVLLERVTPLAHSVEQRLLEGADVHLEPGAEDLKRV